MKLFIASAVVVTILAALVVAVMPVHADKPYYSSGDHIIKLVVRFDSDCWNEIYARATPKNNNHVLLNYQYIDNNDKPDAGPSETLHLQWYFKDSKMQQTASTNEGRIRTYVTIELTNGLNGETVTKYLGYDAGRRTIDFGYFNMHTDKGLCQ